MARLVQELTILRFAGPRFEDVWLDVDVLPEIIAYKDLLIETAKEMWHRDHPDRERLPKNFESVEVGFREIKRGSVAIPLFRQIPGEQPPLWPVEDHFDRAAVVIEETIDAVGKDRPIPDAMPRAVLPLFDKFGRTLREGEAICAKARTRQTEVRYTEVIRSKITGWFENLYEDHVEIRGEVRMADLDGRNFVLRTEKGSKIQGKFNADQETAITEALNEHGSRGLHLRGWAEYSKDDGALRRILRVDNVDVFSVGQVPFNPDEPAIWEAAEGLAAAVPAEEWARVPTDLARNLKYYLYGAPKEE
jgi:hypothetical protein